MITAMTWMLAGMVAYSYGGRVAVFLCMAVLAGSIMHWMRAVYYYQPPQDPDRDLRESIYDRHRRERE